MIKSAKKQSLPIKKELRAFLLTSGASFLLLLLLFSPQAGLEGARTGLLLCAEIVIPTLFPFLVLSSFVIRLGIAERFGRLFARLTALLFRLPGASASVLLLGILGGYPVGASACAELVEKGVLTRAEGNRLLSFCINSSPAYIIGAVGAGLLHSAKAGALLYAAHVLSSLLVGLLLGMSGTKRAAGVSDPKRTVSMSAPGALVTSVTDAAHSMLGISAFVVFFSALSALLFSTGLVEACAHMTSLLPGMHWVDAETAQTLLKGFLEVSGGCDAAVRNGQFTLEALSAFLSWSGLSVVFQVLFTVRDTGLSARGYVACRPLHMLFSVLLTILLFTLFPVAIPTLAGAAPFTLAMHNAPASAALLFACAVLLLARAKV
ncbi:MAG: nucleoside recognition domain-containing protein [Ethanoligenens sp.]